jgi:hypothetical protein
MSTFYDFSYRDDQKWNRNLYFVESMNTIQIRQKIHDFVDQADDRLLNMIHSLIEADASNIVGYLPDGAPISKEDLRTRARISAQQIAEGKTISSEDFKKEFETWKKKKRIAIK